MTASQKKYYIVITLSYWNKEIVQNPQIIISGFKASRLWPPPLVDMKKCCNLYQKGGIISREILVQPWIQIREVVQTEILLLPAIIDQTRKNCKNLDANNHLLTREQFNEYDN